MKVLLNAEAFGFGPSASIASIFPSLRPMIEHLDYVGVGHSLDLQRKLAYDNIFNISKEDEFKKLVVNYDVFITALDFEKATWAHQAGVKTIIYDTLLWYWRKIPNIIHECHSYLVQDFYGVREKVAELELTNCHFIPPLVKCPIVRTSQKEIVLINFGGLENPHWDIQVTAQYIRKILESVLPQLEGQKVKIVCSQAHLPFFSDFEVETCCYEKMQSYLQATKFLISTPGLGNLYEAANYKMLSLFLPPANDSQGQQLNLLKDNQLIDNSIDWSDLVDFIDYKNAQLKVLSSIRESIHQVNEVKLKESVIKGLKSDKINSRLPELLKFGVNGHCVLSQKLISLLEL
jgi:hypothetical protein